MKERDYETFRDPISGLTHDEYFENKYRKKIFAVIILSITVIVLIIVYAILDSKITEKETLIKELKFMKCSSLCPVLSGSSPRQFNQTCVSGCSIKYMANLTSAERDVIDSGSGRSLEVSRGYNACISNMQSDSSFDYSSCFTSFFLNNKDLVDFNDYLKFPYGLN